MTGDDPLSRDDLDDALAAEYVLGVLPLEERVAVANRAGGDRQFAARITAWESRLAGLNAGFDPAPARDLLPAIEARLFPVSSSRPRRGLRWGFLGGAVAAALVAIALILPGRQPVQGPTLTAMLTEASQPLSFAATYDQTNGTLKLVRTSGTAPDVGQDLQLWVIGPSGTPSPLGLLREANLVLPAPGLQAGRVLAVSLEPRGGSPTGLPTGPVLVTGILTAG